MQSHIESDEEKSGLPTVEYNKDRYSADSLIQKVKSRPDLFKPITTRQEKKLNRLKKEERMQFILKELAKTPSHFDFPTIKDREIKRLTAKAKQIIKKEANNKVKKTDEGMHILNGISNEIDFIVKWLRAPIIFDERKGRDSHDQRRVWRNQMIELFDEGRGGGANGPFSDIYRENKLGGNFITHLFSLMMKYQLPAIGLSHENAIETIDAINKLGSEYKMIPLDQPKKKAKLINDKLAKLVKKLLMQLSNRKFTKVEVSNPLLQRQKGRKPTKPETTDWLLQHDDANWDKL